MRRSGWALPVLSCLLASCVSDVEVARQACNKDYAAIKAQEMASIARGMTVFEQVREEDYSAEQRVMVSRARTLMESRTRVADADDLRIIDRARKILSDESVWDRADDRECGEEDTKFSLYCALFFASQEIAGEYQHRRTALQEVRFALQDATVGREYDHRLRDFNNDPATRLQDIYDVLAVARSRLEQRLNDQYSCRL